ncbi:MAG: hypothetical protein F6K28_46780 [Microcoleus sp. SIO2G3]|nr:hypothetical protein [Microcoleus sp. SIO2G3]
MLSEPTTTLTDYAIALESLIFAGCLIPLRQTACRLWGGAFVCLAIAAILGGTVHGFIGWLTPSLHLWLWRLMLCALSGVSFCLLAAAIMTTIPRSQQTSWLTMATVKALCFIGLALHYADFGLGVADYLSAMALMLVLQLWGSPMRIASWIAAGVSLSGIAAIVQQSGWAIGAFDANGLYHLVQMGAIGLFFQGARLSKDT